MYYRKIQQLNNVDSNLPNINDKDFISWTIDLNKDLLLFWEVITEDIIE